MENIQGKNNVESIGVNKLLCTTGMSNKIYILNDGRKYKEFSEDYQNLSDSTNQNLAQNLIE